MNDQTGIKEVEAQSIVIEVGPKNHELVGLAGLELEARAIPIHQPAERCEVLHEIFEAQVDRRPQSTAVEFGAEQLSYAALECRANRIARHLRGRGVRCGARVAMLLPRSTDTYAALLGILKAGAAYVPIEIEYPANRVAYILGDSGAQALLTTSELAPQHLGFCGEIIRLDAESEAIEAESAARLGWDDAGVGPRDLCYIIYTSGSTGRPKGRDLLGVEN